MNSNQLDIPQFVVIHDQIDNTYKHPVIHYVFEDEDFPDVPKDKLILVDLDSSASQLQSVDSYSPYFQVTDCVLEPSQMTDQFDEEAGLINLTIEGVSASKITDVVDDIHNADQLKEMINNFKTRNKIIEKVLKRQPEQQDDSSRQSKTA